ncbi:transposase [Bacillus cereus group sp. BfR-BA-01349]|uniref:transposase n=1 Tax=Bacillus cereus group sp. BfR-BA-01349 TaxID=2920312 RepID=UPI001F56CCC8
MKKQYDEMFKKQCVELVVKEGRTISSIQREFDLGNGTLNAWIKKYSSPFLDNEKSDMEELRSLRRKIQALKKENEFLKKAATFFASNQN